jgi:cytochrome c oxidase subunit 2
MEQSESRPASHTGQAIWFALSIWLIIGISLVYFLKWGVPPLASDRVALDNLYYLILGVTGVAYVITQALLGYYVWRYRDREGAPRQYWHESHKLELLWTLGTAAILVVLVFMGLRLWSGVYAAPPPNAFLVDVVGAQFQWDMRYPGPDGVLGRVRPELISDENPLGIDRSDPQAKDDFVRTNLLVLPVDRPALLRLRSKDMQHAFFLPNFRVKQDLVPGMTIDSWFVPRKTGEFEIACAELCGLGHYRMRGLLNVMTEAEVEKWLADQVAQEQAQ